MPDSSSGHSSGSHPGPTKSSKPAVPANEVADRSATSTRPATGGVICRNFAAGHCQFGKRCRFKHPGYEERSVAQMQVLPRLKRPSKWPEEEEEIKTVPKVGPRLDNAGKDITTDTDSGPSRDLMDKHNAEHRDAALQERLAQQKTQAREENLAAESKTRRDQGLERNEFAAARRREAADSRVAYLAREAKREAARLAAQEAARAREAQRVATEREALRRREARERQEAARQVQLAEQEALRFKEEAAVTSQHLVLKGSTRITCRAGLEIQNVVTGFESCRLTIRNIPSDAKRTEILDLFTQQGLRRDDVHIISFKFVDGDLFEAQILMHDEQGRVLALGLDGIEFRNKILRFEAGDDTLAHAMGESSSRQIDTLTITWPAPSRSIIARYNTMEAAEAYARYLNGIEVKEGRRIKAEMNQPPSGPALRYYIPSSVRIWGVPVEVPLEAIIACARTESVRELMPKFLVSTKFYREIRAHLRTLPHIRLIGFDFDGTSIDGISTARARFESWDQAQLARTSLEAQRTPWPHMNLRLYLPQPLYFVSTISDQQYTAQKRLWDSLDGAGEGDAGRVKIQHMPDKGVVRIQLSGDDKKIVGALKVRVETLAAGERLDASHWHRGFLAPDGRAFLATLFSLSGAFVRVDYKVLALRVYGEEAAKQRARRRIWRKISDLAFQEKTVFLKRRSVGYFVRTGLAALKEICGEGSVILDLASAPCTITVRGGEEARHALNTHIDESLVDRPTPNTGDICPICYDEATHPIKLGCKHIYCTACLRHYLTSAPETKLFPLFCMGDETRCKVPIPIPTIKRFFNHQQYEELVDIAFSTYIGQHPREFRYCTTPDCPQVYRCASLNTTVKCPSCFAEMCPSCHEEAHDGMTCGERRARKEQLDAAWATAHGLKRCPACRAWLEKIEGCNNLQCSCGAHICWVCVSAFEGMDEAYAHLRRAHGGYYDENHDN